VLNPAGWSAANDLDARRGDGKRFIVRAEENLTAFIELEAALRKKSIDIAFQGLAESYSR